VKALHQVDDKLSTCSMYQMYKRIRCWKLIVPEAPVCMKNYFAYQCKIITSITDEPSSVQAWSKTLFACKVQKNKKCIYPCNSMEAYRVEKLMTPHGLDIRLKDGGEVVSLTLFPRTILYFCLWYSFLSEAE
jgi:hypothetical protein